MQGYKHPVHLPSSLKEDTVSSKAICDINILEKKPQTKAIRASAHSILERQATHGKLSSKVLCLGNFQCGRCAVGQFIYQGTGIFQNVESVFLNFPKYFILHQLALLAFHIITLHTWPLLCWQAFCDYTFDDLGDILGYLCTQ